MIDRIQAMRTFIRIVDTNSFTRAAESLDMPRATATTLVQNLEALLGTALLVRTTRRLSLTPEGAAYYERCMQILADIDEMEASLRHSTDQLSGRLRVEMPGALATASGGPLSWWPDPLPGQFAVAPVIQPDHPYTSPYLGAGKVPASMRCHQPPPSAWNSVTVSV